MIQDTRTIEQITHHYRVETELADRLRHAPKEERRALYNSVYDDLYSRVTDIPHANARLIAEARAGEVTRLIGFLRRFFTPGTRFLEIGPGDCRVSVAASAIVRDVHAIDVTRNLVDPATLPANVHFSLSDGLNLPLPDGSVDVAFTDQVLEHLHPEDAGEHLREVRRVLAPGGRYVCITPNRLYGPHDVSKHFDDVARGLHLKEYSVTELMRAFKDAGYSQARPYTLLERVDCLPVPRVVVWSVEAALDTLPRRPRVGFACTGALRWILRSRVIGTK